MPGVNNAKKRKHDTNSSKKSVQKRPRSEKTRVKTGSKIIDIPEQSRQLEDQDEEFFKGDEVGDFSFLKTLSVTELGKRVQKEKVQPEDKPTKARPAVPKAEKDSVNEYSDEADLSDAVSDAIGGNGAAERDWDEEQAYEQKPRSGDMQWRKKESTKLPVRSVNGRLLQMDASESESSSSEETEESDSDDESEREGENTPAQTAEDEIKSGPEAIIEAKEALARLAEEIVESPEEKASNLKAFRELFNKGDLTIKKLALVTQLTVYKDIIPGYRIRPLTDAEKTSKVSKEVKQLRAFEESILSNYKAFISSLVTIIKSTRTNQLLRPLSIVAISCATSLLVAVPHFNFRTELLKVIIAQVSRKAQDEAFTRCREALETLFRDDEDGRASLEAMSMISKMVKTRNYKVQPSIIQSVLHLRLLTELGLKASTDSVENPRLKKKNRIFRTKKERKELKERKKVEKDLAEADAQVSAEERERLQSETLKIVFSLYFRILKETDDDAMLSVVLDGIAKFARLINAEFFGDLLEVLREILEGWDDEDNTKKSRTNRVREELVCLNTAFTLLANQEGSKIDLSFFVQRFYDLLPDIGLSPALLVKPSSAERSLMELVVRIVDAILFTPPTAPPPARISLFYKRLLTCSLQMEEKEATTFLKLLKRISGRFEKKVEGMWDREGAGLGDADTGRGVRGWELAFLKQYYCNNISELGKALWRSESKES